MKGEFIKANDIIFPIIFKLGTARIDGLTASSIALAHLVRADGTVLSGAIPQLTSLGNGSYKLTLSSGHNPTKGINTIILSGALFDSQEIDMQVVNDDVEGFLAILSGAIGPGGVGVQVASAGVLSGALTAGAVEKIGNDVMDQTLSDHTTAGSFSKKIQDLDADVWLNATRTLTALGSAAVDSIWDQLLSNITTSSTIGKLLKDNIDASMSDIITDLDDIKGAGFVTDTHSLKQILSGVIGAGTTTISAADMDSIATAVLRKKITFGDAVLSGESAGRRILDASAAALGKREVTGGGTTMTQHDKDNSTLVGTFTITRDSNDKITKRTT